MTPESKERERLEEFKVLCCDEHPEERGVLLSDQIEHYVRECKLIDPFVCENLKPAGYEVTIGNEAMLQGEKYNLEDFTKVVRIPPYEVVILKTEETFNLPRFIVGRWNIRVAYAYKGLLWVGGVQIDPGYVGHLFCPIYNLSDKDVVLRRGVRIATIDFTKTTAFTPKSKPYKRPPNKTTIEDYEVDNLKCALGKVKDLSKELEGSSKEIRGDIRYFTAIVFTILAILTAAIGVQYVNENGVNTPTSISIDSWIKLSLIISVYAAFMSLYNHCISYCRYVRPESWGRMWWSSGAFAFLATVIAGWAVWQYVLTA